MTPSDLRSFYERYIACLNRRDWTRLGDFVAEDVIHNGQQMGVLGYRSMLENDCATIPDLVFQIQLLACEPPLIASRLAFDCSPRGRFLGLPVDGRRVAFTENVFYVMRGDRIAAVASVIDRMAIEAQLPAVPATTSSSAQRVQ